MKMYDLSFVLIVSLFLVCLVGGLSTVLWCGTDDPIDIPVKEEPKSSHKQTWQESQLAAQPYV